jgi:hypothetical protein
MMDEIVQKALEDYPFLSFGTMLETDYLGIIGNCDNQLLSMYVYTMIPDADMRQHFVACGEEWWWGSNRQIPISIFLKDKFKVFRPYLRHFARKDFNLMAGPSVSLQETIARRVRKRQVTLVRKID